MSPSPHASRGFTLVELLVVLSIIGLLMGIVITVSSSARRKAKTTVTTVRMDAILSALENYQSEGGLVYALQTRIIPAPAQGRLLYTADPDGAVVNGQAVGTWPTADHVFPVDGYTNFITPWGKADFAGTTRNYLLHELDPSLTAAFLQVAGILTATDDPSTPVDESTLSPTALYQSVRGSKYAWNDGWGNPLVVAYSIYQPDFLIHAQMAKNDYGYNRSIYVAVASAGPVVTLGAWPGNLTTIWNQANAVCNTTWHDGVGGDVWTSSAMAGAPPWTGITVNIGNASHAGQYCLLSSPREIK